MRTSKHQTTRKLIAGGLSIIVLLGTSNLYAANGWAIKNKDSVTKVNNLEKEVLKNLETAFEFNFKLPAEEMKTFKIFDANDNLVHEVKLNIEKSSQDKKLVKYLSLADFVMEHGDTRYYKISKK